MALFQPRTGWDRLRLREKKKEKKLSFRSIQSQPRIGISKKIAKKFKKLKKHCYGFFSSQNGTGQAENERKKIFSFRSIPTLPEIGISKKKAKK